MILYLPKTHDPYFNLALEDYLLAESDEDICMLWQNDPVVVIGRNQNAYAEVDLGYTAKNNIAVARRQSGGGAVYHDLGNVNYTFITKRNDENTLNFALFSAPILSALDSLGIRATLSGRNDLTVDGAKFSGAAQRTTEKRILHHGTLLFDSDLSVLSRVLTPAKIKISSKAVSSVRSRVRNLLPLLPTPIGCEEFIVHVSKHFIKTFSPSLCDIPEKEVLASSYFSLHSDPHFNLGKKGDFSLQNETYGPFGYLSVGINAAGGILKSIRISGDFFSVLPIEELENHLIGTPLTFDALSAVLQTINTDDFIRGITQNALVSLILGEQN